jgi:hypothetical protein
VLRLMVTILVKPAKWCLKNLNDGIVTLWNAFKSY